MWFTLQSLKFNITMFEKKIRLTVRNSWCKKWFFGNIGVKGKDLYGDAEVLISILRMAKSSEVRLTPGKVSHIFLSEHNQHCNQTVIFKNKCQKPVSYLLFLFTYLLSWLSSLRS